MAAKCELKDQLKNGLAMGFVGLAIGGIVYFVTSLKKKKTTKKDEESFLGRSKGGR